MACCYWKFCWFVVASHSFATVIWNEQTKDSSLRLSGFEIRMEWRSEMAAKEITPHTMWWLLYLCIFHAVARSKCHTLNASEDLWRENKFRLKCLAIHFAHSPFDAGHSNVAPGVPINRCISSLNDGGGGCGCCHVSKTYIICTSIGFGLVRWTTIERCQPIRLPATMENRSIFKWLSSWHCNAN